MTSGGIMRLREIAARRLASARAMRSLVAEQPGMLAGIDAAARGELPQAEADAILDSHLAARDACIASMRSFDDEWRALAAGSRDWTPAEPDSVRGVVQEVLELLVELERADERLAAELAARRRDAGAEIARGDQGRAAHRAYGASGAGSPRFTDRRG